MSFWEEHNASEEVTRARERLPQNAPMQCATCPHFGVDVMLGVCDECLEASQ
jgi:hypothetical protein